MSLKNPFARKVDITETKTKTFNPLLTDIKKIGPVYFYTRDAHIVDKICRVLFPCLFFMFNLSFFLTVHYAAEETVI